MTELAPGLDDRLFPVLDTGELDCLASVGEVVEEPTGSLLYEEGRPLTYLYAVQEGTVVVTRRADGREMLLARHRPGNFTGDLNLLIGGRASATGRTETRCRLIRLSTDGLRRLMVDCPALAGRFLDSLSVRTREGDALVQQREKLASLGRMAAGLAHEINNPAAAALQSARQLARCVADWPNQSLRVARLGLSAALLNELAAFHARLQVAAASPTPLTPLERSDRVEELADWLDAHGVADAWTAAPLFVAAGLDRPRAEELSAGLPPGVMPELAQWLAAGLDMAVLVRTIEDGCGRVSGLVQAVKEYSFMDQSSLHEVDLHQGLEGTLVILGHKLRAGRYEVTRDYDPALPHLCANGGELNQVWTNLIDNALDAMSGTGRLTLRTAWEGDHLMVEVGDTGPGIAPELYGRIFEPFYTTKPVGQGTGLGLDVVRRLVVQKYGGDVRVLSRPGDTRFQVRLPAPAAPCPTGR
jgi:signal transduction histidine kinase